MKIQISTFIGFLVMASIHAQQSVNTAGGGATSSAGSVSYSVGQVVYTTQGNNAGITSAGVQHAYEIFTTAANDVTNNISLSTFPNPATDRLVLQVEAHPGPGLDYLLHDAWGKLLKEAVIKDWQTEISMADLPAGVYFLHVQAPLNQTLKTFKIIKTE